MNIPSGEWGKSLDLGEGFKRTKGGFLKDRSRPGQKRPWSPL